ncbi:hypothetical protein EV361DRAFT_870212 [Lentinula raphanica]|nr:hypothetical protein F5880DRAFT_1610076 [Lentinula raphanica]KAJ3969266.1 hypothetical protein EV361DRAFT_870212 [Lentinula raphanica]
MSIDTLYDLDQAKQGASLERIQGNRRKDRKNHTQISDIGKTKGWEANVKIVKFYEPNCWRMVQADGSDEPHEVVFHMQGIIEGKCLPPFKTTTDRQTKKIRHIRQWIVISGLGNEAFEKDREGIMEVYALFARIANGVGGIEFKTTNERDMVEIGNRLFTPKDEAPNMEWAEIDEDMDSMGFMRWVKTNNIGLVYGEENVVKYGEEYTKITDSNPEGKKRTMDIIPQKLHVGDIVDVGFTMVGIEGGKMSAPKAKLLLRTVTLIDSKHAQDWIKAKAKAQVSGTTKKIQFGKRNFEDDEIEGTRKKFQLLTTQDEE